MLRINDMRYIEKIKGLENKCEIALSAVIDIKWELSRFSENNNIEVDDLMELLEEVESFLR
jgi:hypothetical protein